MSGYLTGLRHCVRCLYPSNHPLGITFDDDGVCSGCRVHEEKDNLDWNERFERLRRLTDSYRCRAGGSYDCIVPVSGARDSWFIVHVVKNLLKLNPLLVAYNRHWNTPRGIRNLSYLRTRFDCDLLQQVVQPQVVKRVVRETLDAAGSIQWHVLAGHTAYPVQTAVCLKVPLVIWGVHQGVDQVGMFSHLDEAEMSRKYRCDHDLMGWEAEDLANRSESLSLDDLRPWFYPHDAEIAAVGVRGIYLGNYIRWDTKAQHEQMLALHGYETAPQARTFDTYSDVDDMHYSGVHDAIKWRKWGYGKVVDHASREIRLRRMTREEGAAAARRLSDVAPSDMPKLLEFLGMSRTDFWTAVDRFRDPRAWIAEDGAWRLAAPAEASTASPRAALSPRESSAAFMVTPNKAPGEDERSYVLLTRGWVDGVAGDAWPPARCRWIRASDGLRAYRAADSLAVAAD
jgi:N-acetyl sugar amidotransferase